MRVGLLTSYRSHEVGYAWISLPLMRRYCRLRGYTLVVGDGLSAEAMFEQFAPDFETAMLFVPINAIVSDPLISFHHLGKEQTKPPPGLFVLSPDIKTAERLACESLL